MIAKSLESDSKIEECQRIELRSSDPKTSNDGAVPKHADVTLVLQGAERVAVTVEESNRIRKKTDHVVLIILIWVYFLQILDKSALGYGSIFGLQEATHLHGKQYSMVGSIAPIAQLCWQPFSSVLIVKVPHRILMPTLCLGWGIAQAAQAASKNYSCLLASRFFLGLFEAGCLPLFSIITAEWYRRAEQPTRVAAWYSGNGCATIIGSALSYGLAHIPSQRMESWQIIFLFVGLLTIISAPIVYIFLPNDIPSARFLSDDEKRKAVERLRANQTGAGSREFKWSHIYELCLEPKTYLWVGMSLLLNVGASVTNTFGPLILDGLGFDKYTTSLLNMPFGAVQVIVIILSSVVAQKCRIKSAILATITLPVVAGLVVLYVVPRSHSDEAALLVGFYLLAFLFGGNPIIVAWIVGNTAGTTKKSALMSLYQAGAAAGNILGPLLFNSKDAPGYHPGLRSVLAVFVALIVVTMIQLANLVFLNKLQTKKRVRNGKQAVLIDRSMDPTCNVVESDITTESQEEGVSTRHEENPKESQMDENAFLDLTDRQNDEFIYIY
ncbi:MFS general substrate transporter [Xylona heveae TC161]|uniref:MFS general substrate transporter n=1 Tax=Xylona heveae (strain CBS 132557 / TC161) TaxID=1328760 RepID=A0A165FH64_XYLHT|nr:MFS general substrate transporter [Xylona heveae TC161]KZF20976.1 MFS general substrate transporter [Xylona heveae TC161]